MLMCLVKELPKMVVGNGISIVLLINIISGMPSDLLTLYCTFVAPRTIAKCISSCNYYCNSCCNGSFSMLLTGWREKNSCSVFTEGYGRKTFGGQSITYL